MQPHLTIFADDAFKRGIPIAERFWPMVDRSSADGCWPFRGSVNRRGYGQFSSGRDRRFYAHRVAYELAYGPLPDDSLVCHHCDNPPCCNPAHLFAGTPADNVADMKAKHRGIGPRGLKSGQAKLAPDQVLDIRVRVAAGEKQRAVAARYGVSPATVNLIVKRKNWSYL